MDELVRSELDSGLRVADVLATIKPLADSVLDTPGLTTDGEEAFLGALDALMGNCRTEQRYIDSAPVAIGKPDA